MDTTIKKVLLLGSGALKIGEAGEFDYSGSQALKALREEGIETVLINPNIATVQTSEGVADHIYFLPVTPFFVEKVIAKERPQGILLSFGGQTALNCGVALYKSGILEKYDVQVLGTPVQAIMDTEDRELFVKKLDEIDVKTIKSEAVENIADARAAAARLGYPVIVKPARQGSSIGISVAEDRARLIDAIRTGFAYDDLLIAEKYFEQRREINCACYKSGERYVVSPCEEPKTSHKFLTFGDKYLGGAKEHASQFPAQLPRATAETIQGITRMLYRRLRLRGVVRADFLVVGKDVYFNEMNTVPGSLAWYLFCEKLSDFKQMLTELIEQGICDFKEKSGKKMLKNCGVLSAPSLSGKNRG